MNTRVICGGRVNPTNASTVWPDGETAPTLTKAEKAALEWAESLTHVDVTHAPDAAYEPLTRHYDDKQVANITYAIALMNAWNRIGIGFQLAPQPHSSEHSA
jgi:alkylhydroperoxidase family enzyme